MKLIIADLDGTLVHQQKITDKTKETIKKLKDAGHMFTIATGRHMHATKEIARQLNVLYPVICTNGAFIYDFNKDVVIHEQTIDSATVLEVMTFCDNKEIDYLLYTTKGIIATNVSRQKLVQRIGTFEAVVVPLDEMNRHIQLGVIKILVIDDDIAHIKTLKNYLDDLTELHYVQSQPSFLDIGHYLSTKGNALKKLTQYLNINLEDVLAIGDQENDISMIEVAGIGVAMGNGQEALKKAADFITKTYDEDGFAHAIDVHIFNKNTVKGAL